VPCAPVLSRRAAVAGTLAAVAALVSACTRGGSRPGAGSGPSSTPTTPSPTPDPDVALADAVLSRERALLDRVLATLHAHPTTGAVLGSARHAHQAHVRLLAGAVPTSVPTPVPTPSASPSASASAAPSPVLPGAPSRTPAPTSATHHGVGAPPHVPAHVPTHLPAALAAVAGAEQRLAAFERDAGLRARSGRLARLLAGMAASAAQQAAHLSAAAGEPKR
jgi:hypothetical protein